MATSSPDPKSKPRRKPAVGGAVSVPAAASAASSVAAEKRRAAEIAAFFRHLEASDQTVAGWARANGFRLQDVYHVTNGRTLGARGQSRAVARAMGLTLPSRADTVGEVAA